MTAMKLFRLLIPILVLCNVAITEAQPTGINTYANHIVLNGDDWDEMIRYLNNTRRHTNKFTIVHIGDSHIQPGIVSDEV